MRLKPKSQAHETSDFLDVVSFFLDADFRGVTPLVNFRVALGYWAFLKLFDATINACPSQRHHHSFRCLTACLAVTTLGGKCNFDPFSARN